MPAVDNFRRRLAQYRAAILHDVDLGLAARVIGYELADCINPKSFDAWPSQEWLASRLGLTTRTVRRAVPELVEQGWFTIEMDGRSWRYIPNEVRWHNGGKKPAKMSGIDNGQNCIDSGQSVRSIPDKMGTLSSLKDPEERSYAPSVLIPHDRASAMRGLARKQGAPRFVFEGSEPWKAWCDYRKRNGIPGALPTRQQMIDGRLRTGWDVPTLWPPGYSRGLSEGGR
jgi:Helix-turn-helix domain